MISHIFVGVTDFERALAFYRALMPVLDIDERFCEPQKPWAAWQSRPDPRPLFIIGKPWDGQPHTPGNGQMTALLATSREQVERAHVTALQHGGSCEGPPGLRLDYHAHYFGAYFRDPDGNKLCVVCHAPPKQDR